MFCTGKKHLGGKVWLIEIELMPEIESELIAQ